MRITMPIVAVGSVWNIHIPRIDSNDFFTGDGAYALFDDERFRKAVRNMSGITHSSDDTPQIHQFAAVLIASINDWFDDNERTLSNQDAKLKRSIGKREMRGKFAHCRITLRPCVKRHGLHNIRGIRVSITSTDNGVVMPERYDRNFAALVLSFVERFNELYRSHGDAEVDIEEETKRDFAPLLDELYREAEEEEIKNLRSEKKAYCPNRVGGYCSPVCNECPFINNGKCGV